MGHLEAMGYKVNETHLDKDDRVELATQNVFLYSRAHPEHKFYILLHELGHVHIFECGISKFASEYPMYVGVDDKRVWKSHRGRVSVLGEEYEAWKYGRQFARENNLFIDDNVFNKVMTQRLIDYIRWAAK